MVLWELEGYFKINFGGASRRNLMLSNIESFIRDNFNKVVYKKVLLGSNNVVEMEALSLGVSIALALNIQQDYH